MRRIRAWSERYGAEVIGFLLGCHRGGDLKRIGVLVDEGVAMSKAKEAARAKVQREAAAGKEFGLGSGPPRNSAPR